MKTDRAAAILAFVAGFGPMAEGQALWDIHTIAELEANGLVEPVAIEPGLPGIAATTAGIAAARDSRISVPLRG